MNNLTLKTKYNLYSGSIGPSYTSQDKVFEELYGNFLAKKAKLSSLPAKNIPNTPDSYYGMKNINTNKPKGRLVQGSLIPHPFKEFSQATKTFAKALKGEGNDHTIGKLNDPAIALGAGVIATILAAAQKSPHKKAMEFVGAGAWLASMTLWPKIFLAKPVKAATGVDLNLEYINSQGQRKPFFQDPQYMPWDLMDDKTLEKAGEKLNVPKNIPARNEEIQERMTKVASGVNTWWMLSAGFSTPFMASFIANRLEKPAETIVNKAKVISAEAHLAAAGYDTGSKNILVRIGAGFVNMFSKSGKVALEQEEKALKTVLETKNLEAVETFFGERLGKSKLFASTMNKVREAFKKGKQDKIVGMFKDASKFKKAEGLFDRYVKATLDYAWGTERVKTVKKFIKNLGIKGKQLEHLAESRDVWGNSKLVAQRIIDITEQGNVAPIKEKLTKTAEPALKNVEKAGEFATGLIGKFRNKFKEGPLESAINKRLTKMEEEVINKGVNVHASLNLAPVLDHGKEGKKQLAGLVRRLTDHDVHNNKGLMADWGKTLEKMYGKDSRLAKWLKKIIPANTNGKTLIQRLGETPANMLHNIAEQVHGESKWFKKLPLCSGGAVLTTSAAALYLIIRNAKKNDEVKGETA